MTNDRVARTLDALVDEAYRIALDRGTAITNPDKWRSWKRNVYADTARREGPGYLRHHYQRLGLGTIQRPPTLCAECAQPINGIVIRRDDDDPTPYCSNQCAGIITMTLTEYLATLPDDKRANMLRLLNRQEGAA